MWNIIIQSCACFRLMILSPHPLSVLDKWDVYLNVSYILFMVKVNIIVHIKWSHRPPTIMMTTEFRVFIVMM
jgi:hypothetical protein